MPTSRITTPFNAESTAAEVLAGVNLSGRRAIVTGGSSGIGVETARALAAAGADGEDQRCRLAAGDGQGQEKSGGDAGERALQHDLAQSVAG